VLSGPTKSVLWDAACRRRSSCASGAGVGYGIDRCGETPIPFVWGTGVAVAGALLKARADAE
jgi:hypothetical protein